MISQSQLCPDLKALVEKHGGKVPDTLQELEQLAGVGHKTASVVMAVAFKEPTFPVDTHIYRCFPMQDLLKHLI